MTPSGILITTAHFDSKGPTSSPIVFWSAANPLNSEGIVSPGRCALVRAVGSPAAYYSLPTLGGIPARGHHSTPLPHSSLYLHTHASHFLSNALSHVVSPHSLALTPMASGPRVSPPLRRLLPALPRCLPRILARLLLSPALPLLRFFGPSCPSLSSPQRLAGLWNIRAWIRSEVS